MRASWLIASWTRSSFPGTGFAEPEDSLLDEARDEAERTLAHCLKEDISELKLLQEHIHDAVGQLIRKRTGRRPMILPVVLEV